MEIQIFPETFPEYSRIAHRAADAASHVGLEDSLVKLEFSLDSPEFEGSGYWHFESTELGQSACLYGSPKDVLCSDALEKAGPAADLELILKADCSVDVLKLDRWLHRNLLQLDDLLQGRVSPSQSDPDLSAGLQACWDVWTDGRLRMWQHPGLSQAERRRHFYRSFAGSGLLLPRHWETFHELWEGRLANQQGLETAVRRLPAA